MILAIRLMWVIFTSMVRISTIGIATAIIDFFFEKLEDLIDKYISKWNTDYPSTLKFSVCNEYECIFVTEKIKIKKD
jgi:hypothetical protein